jgi:PleD family two-component response regulator
MASQSTQWMSFSMPFVRKMKRSQETHRLIYDLIHERSMAFSVPVVEDDEIVRPLMVEALLLQELGAIECSNSEEAFKVLEANRSISLVVTDVRMPVASMG